MLPCAHFIPRMSAFVLNEYSTNLSKDWYPLPPSGTAVVHIFTHPVWVISTPTPREISVLGVWDKWTDDEWDDRWHYLRYLLSQTTTDVSDKGKTLLFFLISVLQSPCFMKKKTGNPSPLSLFSNSLFSFFRVQIYVKFVACKNRTSPCAVMFSQQWSLWHILVHLVVCTGSQITRKRSLLGNGFVNTQH
jgi:hypothetical protein